MGIFGWDLPPGCRISDIPGNGPDDEICQLCGEDYDACKCEECPACGEQGCIAHLSDSALWALHNKHSAIAWNLEREAKQRAAAKGPVICPTCKKEHERPTWQEDPIWCDVCEAPI